MRQSEVFSLQTLGFIKKPFFAFLLLYSSLAAAAKFPNVKVASHSDWANQPKYRSGEILVRFRPGVSARAIQNAHSAMAGQVVKTWNLVKGLQLVRVPAGMELNDAVRQYRQDPNVLYAEPNYMVHALGTPNDPDLSELWNIQNTGQLGGVTGADIHASQAWNLSTGSSNVVVAILDTGIDYGHPDLAPNVWSNPSSFNQVINGVTINCAAGTHGFNAVNATCDPFDDNAHGSHVSGIIGAVGNNGEGVVGVNWTVKLLSCKFLDFTGNGPESSAITCLEFVKALKDSGVNIVATNNSWGGMPFSQALSDAIAAQQQDGILFIAASGNEFADNDQIGTYPASYDLPNIISVAATTRFDALANFSNIGKHSVHLGAPGQEILSTIPGSSYGVFSGTSMAAPEVTGLAALLAAQSPTRDWRSIKNLILAGGDSIPALSQTVTGRRMNAFGSMSCSGKTAQSRLQPVSSVIAGSVGQAVRLEELNINCGQPNGAVQVTVSPGGTVVGLVDDGSGTDLAAGDGVYSGQWVPSAQGNYTLSFPIGDTARVEVLGNYYPSQTAYNYVSIAGTNLNLSDDSTAQISSPFPVSFGGGNFSNLFVNSNGTISFTEAFDGYVNQPLPQVPPSVNGIVTIGPPFFTMVAPFWHDLYPVANTSQNVFWATVGSAPNRQLVVEWRNLRSLACLGDSSATVAFEAVFTEGSSDVVFNYQDTVFGGACAYEDFGRAATVGIETSPGIGTQWAFDSQDVTSNTAIRWQTTPSNPPPNPVPAVASISPITAKYGDPGLTLTVNGSNFVPQSKVQFNGADHITTFVSATQLTAIIPSGDFTPPFIQNPNNVTVVNPAPGGGTSNAASFTLIYPGPTITSITPSTANAGDFSLRLTVEGTNFFSGSAILWNGQPLTFTVQYSSTKLVGGVLLSQLTNPGTAQITVVNPPPSSGTSNSVPFTIAAAPAGKAFLRQQPVNIPPGTLPPPAGERPKPPFQFFGWKYALSKGGNYLARFMRPRSGAALPVENSATQASVTSRVQVPLEPRAQTPATVPHFLLPNSLPTDFVPTNVATGDFNHDGNPDWAVTNGGSNTLWVYLGKGDGTASLPTIIPLRGQTPLAVVAADFRKSGVIDLAVAEADSGSVEVFLGNGDGTFGPGALYYLPAPPITLAVADFDRDGKLDILTGMEGALTPGSLAMLPGDGAGHFRVPKFGALDSPFIAFAQSIAVADFNGDGYPDVMEVEGDDQVLLSFINQGDGTFKRTQTVFVALPAVGEFILSTALGDLNGDGCADAIVTDTFADVFVFPGNCNGTFSNDNFVTLGEYGLGDVGINSALVDVNGDGKLDIVASGLVLTEDSSFGQVGGDVVSVLLGDGHGNFGNPKLYRGEPSMVGLATADLNKDGFPDFVTTSQDSDTLTVFLNDRQGGFGPGNGSYIGYIAGVGGEGVVNAPQSNFLAQDLNGDGHPDLAVLESGQLYPLPTQLAVSINDGTGKFAPVKRYPVADATYIVGDFRFGDFRNTGKPDVVTSNNLFSGGSFISIAPNLGNGTFGPAKLMTSFNAAGLLGVGDFNGDGKLDLAIAGSGSCPGSFDCLTMLLGNGDGTFHAGLTTSIQPQLGSGNWPGAVYVGDFNRDGKKDLLIWMFTNLVGTSTDNSVELLGNGDGTFQAPKVAVPNLGNFALIDLNHDGLPDIVEQAEPLFTPTFGNPAFNIYLGQPDGSFTLTETYSPFDGDFGLGYFFQQGAAGNQATPMVADFNGDGNPDIAVFQQVPGGDANTFLRQSYMQILLGNGDGTFTPSYDVTAFHRLRVPNHAIDVTGDGRADLVELNQFSSGFHTIPAVLGRAFQISAQSNPVVGTKGGVIVSLSLAASTPTTISLTSSDLAINIAPSVTIPAGVVSQTIPFQIGSSFNPLHVFSIQGQLGTEKETAYGFQASPNIQYGFTLGVSNATEGALPGGNTLDYAVQIGSIAAYASTVQLSCSGLPPGFACHFQENPFQLAANHFAGDSLIVSVPASATQGSYPFKVIVNDAVFSQQVDATVKVGDFTVVVTPVSPPVLPGGVQQYTATVTSVNGFNQEVDLSCADLPSGVTCSFLGNSTVAQDPGFGLGVTVNVPALAQGTYSFNINGTSGQTTHSGAAKFVVGGLEGSVSTGTLTIPTGGGGDVTVTIQSQNGYTGTIFLDCPHAPSGISCSFSPSSVDLVAGGSKTSQLHISVNVKPTSQIRHAVVASGPSGASAKWFVTAGVLFIGAVLLLPSSKQSSRTSQLLWSLVLVFGLSVGFVSCGGGSSGGGGGGGSSGGGGGGGNGGGGGGGSSPVTVQVQVTGSSQGASVSLGTISVTVP